MSYVSEGERERFRALLRQAATEDSRRLRRDRCETEPHNRDRLELSLQRSGIDVRPAITDNAEIMTKPGLRAYRVVFANGQVSVRGSLEAARRVVERLSAHDPPLPGILPAEIWEVRPRSGETGDHQLLVETYPAAEESVTGPSDGESLVPSLGAAAGRCAHVQACCLEDVRRSRCRGGSLAAVVVVRRVLRRFA